MKEQRRRARLVCNARFGMYCEAKLGFGTMKKGEGEVITGWKNKMQAAIAHIAPADVTAEMHRKMAEPGSATKKGAA